MHEMVSRHMEERLVAEQRTLHDDRCDGRHHGRSNQRRIHVADDLLQREQHGCHRSIERGGQGRGGAHRHQAPNASRRQAEPSAHHRGDAGTDLHRGPFASHGVSASDAKDPGQELAKGHTGRDHSLLKVEGRLRLRNSAPTRLREEFRQQDARHQADQRGHQNHSQRRGIESEQKIPNGLDRQCKEHDNKRAENTKNDGQREEYLVLTQAQVLEDGKRGGLRHCAPPCLRAISSNARSAPVGGPHTDAVSSSISKARPSVLIRRSELRRRTLSRTFGRNWLARA